MSLAINNLTVAIPQCAIIRNVSLSLQKGELVGLIGANGAGKSTLLKAILGIRPKQDKKQTGLVQLHGQDITKLSPRARARRIAYLPQEHRVEWDLSVRDVVALGRFAHQSWLGNPSAKCAKIIDECMARTEITSLATRPFSVLSGGEKARVLLARAMVGQTPFLLADEPIAALDPLHQLQVMTLLRQSAQSGQGVLAVIHDLTLAMRFMDRVLLMNRGELIAQGPPQKVLTEENLANAFGITPLSGQHQGEDWLIPWQAL
jgi:iron complex transport system ATP-binding protein